MHQISDEFMWLIILKKIRDARDICTWIDEMIMEIFL